MERLHHLALNSLPGVGPVMSRRLLDAFETAEQVFQVSTHDLTEVSGIGDLLAARIHAGFSDVSIMHRAEAELAFVDKFKIRMLMYGQPGYPARFTNAADCPALLFVKGNVDLDTAKVVSVVGTRHATAYGKALCTDLMEKLAAHGVLIVSGLAWGIDIAAHREALRNGLPTVAVLAHGLRHLYPPEHRSTAEKMLATGALVTEFYSDSPAVSQNFPKRNRIIAGLADATIVVEAAPGGGALITAGIASSYEREVFAFPGRANDPYSRGCLEMIRDNQAQLITSAEDFIGFMNWDLHLPDNRQTGENGTESGLNSAPGAFTTGSSGQFSGRPQLTDPVEIQLVLFLHQEQKCGLDKIASRFPDFATRLPGILLKLELKGVIRQLPGKQFECC